MKGWRVVKGGRSKEIRKFAILKYYSHQLSGNLHGRLGCREIDGIVAMETEVDDFGFQRGLCV